jgi:8-hydroxy-5-deazaflavin:NADPH oxidoreductase
MTEATDARNTRLAILGGSGNEGSGLALRFGHAGFPVVLGSRSPEKAAEVCAALNGRLGREAITFADNQAAAATAEIVILTVPYSAQAATVESVRQQLTGKILVDATVPLRPPKVARVQLPPGGSAVAEMQRVLGEQVRVVSAFQNVSAEHLKDLGHVIDCDVLVCGDDVAAREVVIGLAKAINMRAWHAGPIANSAVAEALTSVLISINSRYKISGAGIRITGLDDVVGG